VSDSTFVTATMNVSSFDNWKPLFDKARSKDGRAGANSTSHWMHRGVDDPNFLMVTFEFGTRSDAEDFRTFLKSDEFMAAVKRDGVTAVSSVHLLEDFEERQY